MASSESNNAKNGHFWNFFFGKKKKDQMKKNMYGCDCCENCHGERKDKTVQTNIHSANKEDEKMPILNVNTYGSSKEMQKPRDCPASVFPLERRGCGFHLYFCFDNKRKPQLEQSKKTKNGKGTLLGDNEADSVAVLGQTHQSYSPLKYSKTTINSKTTLTERETSPSKTTGILTESTIINKTEEKENTKQMSNSQRAQEETKTVNKNNILHSRKTSSDVTLMGNIRQTKTASNNLLINNKSVEEQADKACAVRISSLENYMVLDTQKLKYGDGQRSQLEGSKSVSGLEQQEEALFKEYDTLRKQRLTRIASARSKTGSNFVRNSMISIRKERRSYIDTMVPQILSKLCEIEEKIAGLEKVREDRGDNTTNIVGISCDDDKGVLPIDIKCQDCGGDSNKQISPETSPKANTIVVIKSLGEDIVVNAPENVSVTRKVRSMKESNQLVYHNTQELDAHSIASNPFRKSSKIKSQEKKPDIEMFLRSKEVSRNNVSDKWRRISEELKF